MITLRSNLEINEHLDQRTWLEIGSGAEVKQLLVSMGEKLDKPVVATGNVHYLSMMGTSMSKYLDKYPGRIPMKWIDCQAHFRTTDEM